MFRSIAAKIFGLAVFLLLLTIVLVVFLLSRVTDAARDMDVIQAYDIPLLTALGQLEESGLRRRLAFERWLGALDSPHANPAVISEASANYARFSVRLQEDMARTRDLLQRHPGQAKESLSRLKVLQGELEKEYPVVSRHQQELIALQKSGDHGQVNARLDLLNEMQNTLQRQREELLDTIASMTAASAAALTARQREAYRLSVAASVAAVLLGLSLAALMTQRLTRPVKSLIRAVDEVRDGRLDTALPVPSRDEIGTLTESFNFFVEELRAKEHIKRTFGHYLDPRVLEYVLSNNSGSLSVGDRQRMTILFADIVGFTELSERLTPALLVRVLNRHFTLQAAAVQAQAGVVDKFIGDALLAFWGPPFIPTEDQVTRALRAALAQWQAVQTLQSELAELTGLQRDTPQVSLRIGIATGDVLVGNIGSDTTRSYTVIGDTVNQASRIEALNRVYGTRILLGELTASQPPGSFEVREVDTVAVKGKSESTRLFELLGASGEVEPARLALRDRYQWALAAYRAGNWTEARQGFADCLQLVPDDGASQLMLERMGGPETAAPIGWDGVWRFHTK